MPPMIYPEFRQVPLRAGEPGGLWLHHMPGRHETMASILAQLDALRITTVVCLTPHDEIREKSPEYATALAAGVPWEQVFFPVRDFGIPEDPDTLYRLAESLATRLRAGARVLVHCGAGIGRTGTFACVLLMALGYSHEQSLSAVEEAHAGPETSAQEQIVVAYRARRGGLAP